jgi:hypothetical protein
VSLLREEQLECIKKRIKNRRIEELVGEELAPFKGRVLIGTKFGWDIDYATKAVMARRNQNYEQ